MVYLITGKKNSGKTHYANALAAELREEGIAVQTLDGDVLRGIKQNFDFTDAGRVRNLTEAAKLARDYEKANNIVILSFIAPKKQWRDVMRGYWQESKVIYIPGGTLWPGTTYERPMKDELK